MINSMLNCRFLHDRCANYRIIVWDTKVASKRKWQAQYGLWQFSLVSVWHEVGCCGLLSKCLRQSWFTVLKFLLKGKYFGITFYSKITFYRKQLSVFMLSYLWQIHKLICEMNIFNEFYHAFLWIELKKIKSKYSFWIKTFDKKSTSWF